MENNSSTEKKKVLNGDEYKECVLEELKFLHNHCVKHNITYFLIYGTLLGAVRHNGFIPWDDDIDVILPRKDYYELIRTLKPLKSRYQVLSFDTNPEFTAPLAKLVDTKTVLIQKYSFKEKVEMGAYIDLYILDALPNIQEKADAYNEYCRRLLRHWSIANSRVFRSKKTIIKDIARLICYLPTHFRGYQYYLRKIDEASQKYKWEDTDIVGNLTFANTHDVWFKEDFAPIEHEFEGYKFFIPKGYDRILTIRYGNWRELPPQNERHSDHSYVCYWK